MRFNSPPAITARIRGVRHTGLAVALRERWFAGVTRNGVALVAIGCLVYPMSIAVSMAIGGDDWLAYLVSRSGTSFVIIGLAMLAVVATINRVSPASRWRYAALAAAVVAGTATGAAIVGLVEGRGWAGWRAMTAESGGIGWWLYQSLLFYGARSALFATVYVFFRLREVHEIATRAAELDRARSEQQMQEARLQLLQAQIEPHFLFNTLATVRRLYQTDAAAAEAMLANLMRYLAVALPEMRAASSTLGREAALAESYLEIQRMRMGRRLEFEIDIPQALREAAMPPMMLLTLVENAIKHGIAPVPEGGSVRVSAAASDGELRLQVADSGQGFTKSSGGGTGLANIRARLAGLYGRAAQFALTQNLPRGVIATIRLPIAAGLVRGAS